MNTQIKSTTSMTIDLSKQVDENWLRPQPVGCDNKATRKALGYSIFESMAGKKVIIIPNKSKP